MRIFRKIISYFACKILTFKFYRKMKQLKEERNQMLIVNVDKLDQKLIELIQARYRYYQNVAGHEYMNSICHYQNMVLR